MFVVTLPASAAKDPTSFAKKAKREGAHLLEIRGDITPKLPSWKSPLPLLWSPRDTSLSLDAPYVDLEFHERRIVPRGVKVIRSFHDYTKTPSLKRLQTLIQKMSAAKPWAVKIATHVRDEKDLATLLILQKWLKRKKVRSIVLGMGPYSHLTRVLSPLHNVLTYAVLDGHEASAQGQLPLSFYALLRGRKNPKIFGILGGPHVTASKSPIIHNALFQRHKIDALYSCFPSENFKKTLRILGDAGVTGYSVTAPFKHDAYLTAKKKEKLVLQLGVANTLKKTGKQYAAWLTDAAGVEHGYPCLQTSSTVAVLGAGGAVPSVIAAVQKAHKNAKITVFARDTKKAAVLMDAFGVPVLPLKKAEGFVVDTVICAVSADIELPMPHANIAIDLRYGTDTAFLREAKAQGMKTYDGIPMLVHQALKQFQHFTGKKPKADDAAFCLSTLRHFLPR